MGAAKIRKTCPRCHREYEPDAAFCADDGTPLEPLGPAGDVDPGSDRYIGTVIHGDIELRSVAGVGAMGRVYRAHQRGIDRDVAVKILHRELSGNLPLVQRFHREAKIASRLQHPHVVDVYLAGQLPDGALYIAMEYLDGQSLAHALTVAGGRFDVPRALSIALQICDAVGAGHARGIVHRDLKPENVMLVHRADTDDWVKVLDFGIAKVSVGEQSMETAAGLIFGTARYISPEGAQGATVGPEGDVYAIATILYQMLAGRTPFDAEQPIGLLVKHLHEEPPHLASLPEASGVPVPIARVIMQNLRKRASERAPNARALGTALAAAANEAHVSIADIGVVARMSLVDGRPFTSVRGVPPTLDDANALPAVPLPSVTPAVVRVHEGGPTPVSPRDAAMELRDSLDVTSAAVPSPRALSDASLGKASTLEMPAAPPREPLAPASAQPDSSARSGGPAPTAPPAETRRARSLWLLLVTFVLGMGVAAIAMQQLSARRAEERDQFIERTRRALLDEHYVAPPGENVRELTTAGLARWPNDQELAQVRSDATQALVTHAMASRSGGDLRHASELVQLALEFDSDDRAARILREQYDEELKLAAGGGTVLPSVLLDMAGADGADLRVGERVEMRANVTLNGGPPTGRVLTPTFTVTGPTLPAEGAIVKATQRTPGLFVAAIVPGQEGTYLVVFDANAEGAPLRAERALHVGR